MYNNDIIYSDMDLFSSSNRLYAFNDASNIWTSDKYNSMDFNKPKSLNSNNMPFTVPERFARSRKPPGDRRDTNLIVNYLPDGFYEKDLYDLFSAAGPIVHHHVVRNKDNRSECYGFVDFEKSSDAEKAIEMFHQYQIQNKKLKVQNAAEGLLVKEEERHRAIKSISNIGYNVEIKNAPIRWTINDVKNVFGKYGELLKVYENINSDCENPSELKAKTFNVVYRYHTIAMKVVKKKNNTTAEALWPLELELSIVGQEVIETPVEQTRSRQRGNKQKFDQISDSSWENKVENVYYQRSVDSSINFWTDNNGEMSQVGVPLSSNGRPILKLKDNLMHLNSSIYETSVSADFSEKWNNGLGDATNPFFDNLRGSCNDLKAIWAPKDSATFDLTPHDVYVRTPLVSSRSRRDDSLKYRANIWYKMENMQPTGSFKLRGMAYWCYKAKHDGIQTIVSSSGGNAGLAAAYASRLFKMKCIVIVPVTTPGAIIADLLKENADVIQEGSCWKEAHAKAETMSLMTPRSRLVHPFDNPLLWSGYETIVDEVVADMKGMRVDMIVLSVGGGGLLNGVAQGISKNKLNQTTAILALETEGCACFNRSISANQIVSVAPNSVATSLGASTVSQRTWDIHCSMEYHLFSKTCTDMEAVESCYQFLSEQNCLVEPACGASLSAVYNGTLDKMADCRNSDLNIVVIVCGGRCVEINSLLEARHNFAAMATSPALYDPYCSSNVPLAPPLGDQFSSLDLGKEGESFYRTPPHYSYAVPLANYSNLYSGGARNYASVLSDISTTANKPDSAKLPLGSLDNLATTGHFYFSAVHPGANFTDIASPVGSQHSDKENQMVHLDR